MTWVESVNRLLLPAASIILGGGLGVLWAAGMLAGETGLSLPRIIRLIWERALEQLPVEPPEAGAAPAGRQLLRWLKTRRQPRPAGPAPFPVTPLFRGMLHLLTLGWLALLCYTLILGRLD